jgi:hypothetical protein
MMPPFCSRIEMARLPTFISPFMIGEEDPAVENRAEGRLIAQPMGSKSKTPPRYEILFRPIHAMSSIIL